MIGKENFQVKRAKEGFLAANKSVLHLQGWVDLIRQMEGKAFQSWETLKQNQGRRNAQNVCQDKNTGLGVGKEKSKKVKL